MTTDRDSFLKKFNIELEDFQAAGIPWEELAAIHEGYRASEGKFRNIGKDFVYNYLYDIEKAGARSYHCRTKDPGHLLERVIRKENEQFDRFETINRDNYYKHVTDLIDIRVFFLYREDWVHLHSYITTVFENDSDLYMVDRVHDFDESPGHYYITERLEVYRRNRDTRIYDDNLVETGSDGVYRSLHYIIECKEYYVEIQERTLFEEGRSKINHDIVYPYFKDGEVLKDFPMLLNHLSGMADEISSYSRKMKNAKEAWERKLEEDGRPGEWGDGE